MTPRGVREHREAGERERQPVEHQKWTDERVGSAGELGWAQQHEDPVREGDPTGQDHEPKARIDVGVSSESGSFSHSARKYALAKRLIGRKKRAAWAETPGYPEGENPEKRSGFAGGLAQR